RVLGGGPPPRQPVIGVGQGSFHRVGEDDKLRSVAMIDIVGGLFLSGLGLVFILRCKKNGRDTAEFWGQQGFEFSERGYVVGSFLVGCIFLVAGAALSLGIIHLKH